MKKEKHYPWQTTVISGIIGALLATIISVGFLSRRVSKLEKDVTFLQKVVVLQGDVVIKQKKDYEDYQSKLNGLTTAWINKFGMFPMTINASTDGKETGGE